MHEYARKKGCVVSAFQMNSALLVNQFTNIREKNAIVDPLNQRIFETKEECIHYIETYLSNTQHIQSKT